MLSSKAAAYLVQAHTDQRVAIAAGGVGTGEQESEGDGLGVAVSEGRPLVPVVCGREEVNLKRGGQVGERALVTWEARFGIEAVVNSITQKSAQGGDLGNYLPH
nr:hypothetical protein OG999_22910 [Streptomyces sp. NBC_00886]